MGYGLMIVGLVVIVVGFYILCTCDIYNGKITLGSILVALLGGVVLCLGAIIQDSKNESVAHKACVASGGEWLGKREYNITTKTYMTRYNCYQLKEK